MVYLHFPSNLTDEELMLQTKYSKLRKKKKALEQMKVTKPEPEKINPLKRPLDPKDAKELAKKLIMSGKVSIQSKQAVEKTVFKRPRTLERKILSTGRSEGHGGLTPGYNASYPSEAIQFEPFTPFSHSHADPQDMLDSPKSNSPSDHRFGFPSGGSASGTGGSASGPVGGRQDSSQNSKTFHTKSSFLKNSTTSMKDMTESYHGHGDRERSPMIKGQNKPKRGPTIYIQAHNITEEILKQQFGKFGKIVNVRLNNATVGFITFDKVENAETAVQEMNGITIDDILYDVQFARRQPNITQLINDASASASWTALATSHSQKSNFQDKRSQIVYDEPMDT